MYLLSYSFLTKFSSECQAFLMEFRLMIADLMIGLKASHLLTEDECCSSLLYVWVIFTSLLGFSAFADREGPKIEYFLSKVVVDVSTLDKFLEKKTINTQN